jgi:cbb3-type cytochrome oxidase subunit 3
MTSEWFKASAWLDLATAGQIFFAVFFTAVLAWVLFSKRGTFDEAARLPLADDTGSAGSILAQGRPPAGTPGASTFPESRQGSERQP